MLNKVGKFDAKQDGIRTWFAKHEFYSGMFGWTDEQRVATLSFFLDFGLFRVVQSEEMTSFNEIKDCLFEFVDDLLSIDRKKDLYSNLCQMIYKLEQFKFSRPEQRYWMNFFCSEEKIRKYHENVSKNENDPTNYKYLMYKLLI